MSKLLTLEREGEPFRGWQLFTSEQVVVRIREDAAEGIADAEHLTALFEVAQPKGKVPDG